MMHRRIPLLLLVILLPLVVLAIPMALAGSTVATPKCAATHDDGTTVFATVQEAANAAGPGATIKVAGLCAGVETFDGLFQTLYVTKSLTLRGGYTGTNWFVSDPVANHTTLDAQGLGRVIVVTGTTPVTIENISLINGNSAGNGGGIYTTGDLTLSAVNLISNTATTSGGGAWVLGQAIVNGGLFSGNQAQGIATGNPGDGGGGLYAGSLMVSGAQFISNTAGDDGGAVLVLDSAVLTDVLVEGNKTLRDDGGGLYIAGTLSLAGSQIISNSTEPSGGHGGGLFLLSPATITNTIFKHNLSNGSGGAIFTFDTLDISDSNYEDNHGNGSGGAIRSAVALTVSNSSFVSNSSGARSGAINFFTVDALIQDSHFENNWCRNVNCDGGAIANTSSSAGSLILSNSNFISNKANRSGGAIYNATHISLSEGLISGNVAQGIATGDPGDGGGGLYAGSLMITGSALISNTAGDDGGAVLVLDSAVLTDVLVEGNKTLRDDGGGLYIVGTLSLASSQVISNSTEPSGGHGGGLFLLSPATITNTIFKHNLSNGSGGAVFTFETLDISDSNFADNHGNGSGGAIRSAVALTVSNSSFVSNSGGARSGAINFFRVDALIQYSHFENNWCRNVNCDGGALANTSPSLGTLELRETRFVKNHALGAGGAVFIAGAGSHLIVNNLFDSNTAAGNGAGLYLGNDTTIVHTTIASPTIAPGQAIYINAGAVDIINSIIASHTVGLSNAAGLVTSNYNVYFGNETDVVGVVTQSNIETLDPLFVDPAAGDYRLMIGSSALDNGIDAGIYIDIADATRPAGAGFDRGAYERPVIFRLMLPILFAGI